MCQLLAPGFQGFFFLFFMRLLTVQMKQTRQAERAIKQSILFRCLWLYYIMVLLECQCTCALHLNIAAFGLQLMLNPCQKMAVHACYVYAMTLLPFIRSATL
jgi:hypothetical protein